MKKTILPALAMLIVAAVMLSTASYAWFAMSTEVAVNNMQVSVTSDAANLVIARNATDITDNPKYNTLKFDFEYNENNKPKALLPTAFDAKESDGQTDITNASFTKDVTWYTRTSDDPNDSVTDTSSEKYYIPYADIGKYALVESFYIGVTAGSNDMYNLKAKVSITNVAEAINVLVVCTDANGKYQNFTTTAANYDGATVLAGLITADNPVHVSIYVYYNGNTDNVTSVQLSGGNIDNGIVTVKFSASTSN